MAFHQNHAVSPPPHRFSLHRPKSLSRHNQSYLSGSNSSDDEDDAAFSASLVTPHIRSAEDLPDASRANRRPPDFTTPIVIAAKSSAACITSYRNKIVTGHGAKLKIHSVRSSTIIEASCHLTAEHDKKEIKLSALVFKPVESSTIEVLNGAGNSPEDGRYLWCGTKDGNMMEFDVAESSITATRANVHTAAVVLLQRVGNRIISMDESGKICLWQHRSGPSSRSPSPSPYGIAVDLRDSPITQRIEVDKHSVSFMVGEQLWVATAAESSTSKQLVPRLRMYQPFSDDKPFNAVSRPCSIPDNLGGASIGLVTSGAVIPARQDVVYMGHQTGHISIWNRTTYTCTAVQTVATNITAMAGVGAHLWAGDQVGSLKVFDTSATPWRVVKSWKAHDTEVVHISIDPSAIRDGKLQILSCSSEGEAHLWDGLLANDWLLQQLENREAEFSTYRTINALLFSYNIDANSPEDFAGQGFPNMTSFFASHEPPDIIVLGLQELVNLEDTKIVAKSFLFGGARRGKGKGVELGDRVSHQYRLWVARFTEEIRKSAPVTYTMVVTDNLVGLFTCVFIRDRELGNVKEAQIASIKTGFGGRMGNKGAIAASLIFDDTSIAFVNCHLAAGQRKTSHRNTDLVDILDSVPFGGRLSRPLEAFTGGGDGSMILDHRVVFLSGDLNYRIDLSREHCLELISTRNYSALLAKDQLYREMRHNPAFRLRHFSEAPITFLPTYKYKRSTNEWDPSEKQRVPAYCDRILWHCRYEGTVQCQEYKRLEYLPSDHRPISARFSLKVKRTVPDTRAIVVRELQEEWKSVQNALLLAAAGYYR